MADAGGQRAAAECEQDRVDVIEPFYKFQPDGGRTFAGIKVFAVFYE